jgi:preprotein translocase subunit SecE
MAIKEDIKPEHDEAGGADRPATEPDTSRAASSEPAPEPEPGEESAPERAEAGATDSSDEHEPSGGAASPAQLGTQRFVYAAYFAGAIGIAFIVSKALAFGWFRLQTYRPAIGEPRDEIVMPLSALVGALTAVYYWVRTRARELAEEVATEMSKVTWPSRTEVTNGTVVVIVTTIVSTVFFALMDRFWGFVSNLVYGGT